MDASDPWVRYNPCTNCYETKDGTSVAAELYDNVQCLADVLYISIIRANQRKKLSDDNRQQANPG